MFDIEGEQFKRYQRHMFLRDILTLPFNRPPAFDLFDFLLTCLLMVEYQHLEMLRYYDYQDPPCRSHPERG